MNELGYLDIEEHEYEIIRTRGRAYELLKEFTDNEAFAALDFETTGLDLRVAEIRLTTITGPSGTYVLDHRECGSFSTLAPKFLGLTRWVVFNIGFEGRGFIHHLGPELSEEIKLLDVIFMRRAAEGGGWPFNLLQMVKADLKIEMSKEEQAGAWDREVLTKEQYDYAAYDGYVTWELYKLWNQKMNSGHWHGCMIINSAWRANIEMEETGLPLDEPYHLAIIEVWRRKQQTAERYFRRYVGVDLIKNLNSNQQMSNFLKKELHPATIESWEKTGKTKDLKLDRDTLKQVAFGLPAPMNRWLQSFIIYRFWSKYLSTYGDTIINKNRMAGRVTSRYNMAAAITCRYSSSNINGQNIPRQPYIRRSFCFPPDGGNTGILADYKGIEVRVLAEISGDEALKHDAIYGDVHSTGASLINGIDLDLFREVLEQKNNKHYYHFKDLRNKAKVFTFRLTYGAGLGALAFSLKTDIEGAAQAVEAWSEKYRNAYNYRFLMEAEMNATGYLPMYDGRTVYVPKRDRQLPVAANYPVQGPAASVMYRAATRVRQEFYDQDILAYLMACVHDELLSKATRDEAEAAHAAQLKGMTAAWVDIFPGTSTDNLIDSAIGDTWADKP